MQITIFLDLNMNKSELNINASTERICPKAIIVC